MAMLWPFHGLLSMVLIYHEPPKPWKMRVLATSKPRLFTTNTSEHVGLGGRWYIYFRCIHPWKLTCPLKRDYVSKKYIFQRLIFRGHLSFRGTKYLNVTSFAFDPPPPAVWKTTHWFIAAYYYGLATGFFGWRWLGGVLGCSGLQWLVINSNLLLLGAGKWAFLLEFHQSFLEVIHT